MNAGIVGELRVERCRKHVILASSNNAAVVKLCQNLAVSTGLFDDGSSNKHGREGVIDALHGDVGLEAIKLAPKGIPPRFDVHDTQCWLIGATIDNGARQQNCAGARAPDGHPCSDACLQGLEQVVHDQEFANGGAFATRNNQTVNPVEVAGQALAQVWAQVSAQALGHRHRSYLPHHRLRPFGTPAAWRS